LLVRELENLIEKSMELGKVPQIYRFTCSLSILAYFIPQKRMEVVAVRWNRQN
jgi:hypothetical protein